MEKEKNEEEDDNNLTKMMNLTNIIINNTNKMNINNININNTNFLNLIPQKVISEEYHPEKFKYYIYNENENKKEYCVIRIGKNFIFNSKITNYISKLCVKAIDYIINSKSSQINIREIQTKNIIKYLNDLIKAEWFVLISDMNENYNFEFSFTDSNREDLILFKYKNYIIYIYFLFLKLNTDFNFENEYNEIKNNINEEKSIDQIIKNEENNNEDAKMIKESEKNENELLNEEINEINNDNKEKNSINNNLEDNIIKNNDIKDVENEVRECKNNIEKNEEKANNIDLDKEEEIIVKAKNNEEININIINEIKNDDDNDIKEEINDKNLDIKNQINNIENNLADKNINNEEKKQNNEINFYVKKNFIITQKKFDNKKYNKKEENIRKEPIEEKKYRYDINTFNYRFFNRRQYYKNKNKLKDDSINNISNFENIDKSKEKEFEGKNILSIYNSNSKEEENLNKPNDLIEPSNLYYLRQDIRICNPDIENDKQIYNNLQKKMKRMIINTKIPIFNFDNYKIIETIGEGTYGQLYSVININSKKSYAMKELIASDINYFYQCLNTLGINYHNKHPNILDIYGIYVIIFEQQNFFIYALMDLAEGDWEKEIRRRKELYKYYTEEELILILKQLVSALSFLQKGNIAHRDIKLENILLFPNLTKDKNNGLDKLYKIGDFGEAKNKIKYSKILNTIRGTDYYMSPELLEGVNNQKDFIENNPHKSDVFSLGCCMMIAATLDYEIINSIRNPQTQEELDTIIKTVLNKRYSEKFSNLITKMLVIAENNRIDFINLDRAIKRKYS